MKPKRSGHVIDILLLSLFTVTLSGCTRVTKFSFKPVRDYPHRNKIDLSVQLCLTDEFRNYNHKVKVYGITHLYPLGETFTEDAEIVTRALFRDVLVTKGAAKDTIRGVDAVLTPQVPSIEQSVEGLPILLLWSSRTFETVIYVEWTLTDTQGDLIWTNTIEGKVRSHSTWFPHHLDKAITDLFKKTFEDISSSPEIREFAATN